MEDVHFLSRLERVARPQVELALSLYRDPDLVRVLLRNVGLPEQHERVALSLDHETEGPFVILTREGRFVTCLGQGMAVDDLPIITRQKLDSTTAKLEDFRTRLAAAKKIAGEEGLGQLRAQI